MSFPPKRTCINSLERWTPLAGRHPETSNRCFALLLRVAFRTVGDSASLAIGSVPYRMSQFLVKGSGSFGRTGCDSVSILPFVPLRALAVRS